MQILTDVKDGDAAIAKHLRCLEGEWEFVVSGEGSQSPFHQWKCSFWIQHSISNRLYGLQIVEYGDPSGDVWGTADHEVEEDPFTKVVAVCLDVAPDIDESFAAQALLRTYMRDGGKFIDLIDDEGRFDLTDWWDEKVHVQDQM